MLKIILPGILILGALCLGADKTSAQCTCFPQMTLREEFDRSDEVFVGKVVEVKTTGQGNTDSYEAVMKVEVEQTWKHDLPKFVIVKYQPLKGFTSSFEVNLEALHFAHKTPDGTYVAWSCCTRTKVLSRAAEDLKEFKKWGETPKKIIDSDGQPANASAPHQR
jgi:hypothetical protein